MKCNDECSMYDTVECDALFENFKRSQILKLIRECSYFRKKVFSEIERKIDKYLERSKNDNAKNTI